MMTVGIVAEFNPFHNGHRFLIDRLKKSGARVVCVMSGNWVQRGEPAILPAHKRAECAVLCGADAVLELPFPWSASSAENFARAGVFILSRAGCDSIAFGSESGDTGFLLAEADRLPNPAPDPSAGTAEIYPRLGPNDILAVEYIRAARRLSADIGFVPVKRTGDGHLSDRADGDFPSSGAIRRAFLSGGEPDGLPASVLDVIRRAKSEGNFPASAEKLSDAAVAFWRTADPSVVSGCAECGGGVAGRLCRAASESAGFDEMQAAAATKKYTSARLRRAAWFGMLGVTREDIKTVPAYSRLLAAGPEGRRTVGEMRGSGLGIVTKKKDIPSGAGAERQFLLQTRSDALYGLSLPVPRPASYFIREKCFISE